MQILQLHIICRSPAKNSISVFGEKSGSQILKDIRSLICHFVLTLLAMIKNVRLYSVSPFILSRKNKLLESVMRLKFIIQDSKR
jgi:hypothetical protein